MEGTAIENQLRKIAFLLGAIQGLAYAIMALICIVLYNKDPMYFYDASTYMETVNANLYSFFLSPDNLSDYSLRPRIFTGFAWVYFILHLGWLGVSVEASRKKGVTLPKYLTAWSHLTLLISVWDFITVVILGSDYKKCLDLVDDYYSYYPLDKIAMQGSCATAILPALVIAAKGFVLWIVNVTFALILHQMARQLKLGGQVISRPVVAPLGFQVPHAPSHPQPTAYIPQSPRPTPYVQPTPQNVHRNQFDYSVAIPEPDYQYNKQLSSPPRRY